MLVQCAEEEIARSIAGERPAAGVGAVKSRRQPDDEQPGLARAEVRNRRAVIIGILDL